jgi:AcrR family transcriptional regulator
MNAPSDLPSRPRAGRPTREQADARHAELLDAALDHFLDKGFEPATIEAIAASVNMTKRTVYALYPDKVALFRAAVRRAIGKIAVSEERIRAGDCDDLAAALTNFAHLRVDPVTSPTGLKLQRIINTESYRFPDIFTLYYDLAALPVIQALAGRLAAEVAAGRLRIAEDAMLAANTFVSMAASGLVRMAVSGTMPGDVEIERRITFAVRLFLDGARPRDQTA